MNSPYTEYLRMRARVLKPVWTICVLFFLTILVGVPAYVRFRLNLPFEQKTLYFAAFIIVSGIWAFKLNDRALKKYAEIDQASERKEYAVLKEKALLEQQYPFLRQFSDNGGDDPDY